MTTWADHAKVCIGNMMMHTRRDRLMTALAAYTDAHLALMVAQGWDAEDAVDAIADHLGLVSRIAVGDCKFRNGMGPW